MTTMLAELCNNDVFAGFDPFAGMRAFEKALGAQSTGRWMQTDIRETDAAYELTIDLPGFQKEDVSVSLKDGYLTVAASMQHDNPSPKDGTWLRRERMYGSCQRSFYVGETLTASDCKAGFENGVLKLTVAKKALVQHDEPQKIAIA